MKVKIVFLAVLCLLALAMAQPAAAQVLYGSVIGVAEDPSGASIPNAEVTVTNKATAKVYTDKRDGSGRYKIVNVRPGAYEVKLARGFDTRTDVLVEPNVTTRVDLRMEVGAVTAPALDYFGVPGP